MWRQDLAQDDMAAWLVVHGLADATEGLERVPRRHHPEPRHGTISTTSSFTEGGIASPCFSKLAT